MGLDQLPTYGILSDLPRNVIREYIEHLISSGYLALSQGEYPVLGLTAQAREVLFCGQTVSIPVKQQPPAAQIEGPGRKKRRRREEEAGEVFFENPDDALMERLRALRFRLAREAQVPAYVIFTNATLSAMAARRPTTTAGLLDTEISSVYEYEKLVSADEAAIDAFIREYAPSAAEAALPNVPPTTSRLRPENIRPA